MKVAWDDNVKRVVLTSAYDAIIGYFNTGTTVVYDGILILPIPGVVKNPLGYVLEL